MFLFNPRLPSTTPVPFSLPALAVGQDYEVIPPLKAARLGQRGSSTGPPVVQPSERTQRGSTGTEQLDVMQHKQPINNQSLPAVPSFSELGEAVCSTYLG